MSQFKIYPRVCSVFCLKVFYGDWHSAGHIVDLPQTVIELNHPTFFQKAASMFKNAYLSNPVDRMNCIRNKQLSF